MTRSSSSRRASACVVQLVAARVAGAEHRRADLGELRVGGVVLGARVAVAEVAREVERERLGQALGLGDRVGWSAKRAAIAAGVASTWAWLPRRSGSEASSVVCSRIATKASCSRARAGEWACTSPVATHGTPSRAPAPPARGSACGRGGRTGRCSSTRKRVAPEGGEQPAHRRLVADPVARAARQADEPLRVLLERLERDARLLDRVRLPGVSRVCACARVSSRQRLRQPRSSRTSSVTWRSPSTVSSQPWIAFSPNVRAACANSIDPEIVSWSVSASAVCPRSTAAIASSSGSDAPSRKENAECAWSST